MINLKVEEFQLIDRCGALGTQHVNSTASQKMSEELRLEFWPPEHNHVVRRGATDPDNSVSIVTASADPAMPTPRAAPEVGRNLGSVTARIAARYDHLVADGAGQVHDVNRAGRQWLPSMQR